MKPRLLLAAGQPGHARGLARGRFGPTPGPTGTCRPRPVGYTRARMRPAAALTAAVVPAPRRLWRFGRGADDRREPRTAARRWRSSGARPATTSPSSPGRRTTSPATFACRSSSSTPRAPSSRLPTARVWVATEPRGGAVPRDGGEARAHRRPGRRRGGCHAHLRGDAARCPRPGSTGCSRSRTGGAEQVQALGNVVVRRSDPAPDVGDTAPRVRDADDLARRAGTLAKLTTRTPPDESLLEHSVADSLAAKVPFVVTFATPKFCSSRTCGPVVDVVEEVAAAARGRAASASSTSRSTRTTTRRRASTGGCRSGSSPTEPWTFLVGADGRIVERFEGTVSVNELEAAVREKLAQ